MTWTWRGPNTIWQEATGTDSPRDVIEAYLDDRGPLPPRDIVDELTDWYVSRVVLATDNRMTVTPLGVAWLRPRYTLTRTQALDILGHAYRTVSIHDVIAQYRRDHTDYEPHQGDLPRGVR